MYPAATTDDVSFMAVPAKRPKPCGERFSACPMCGKMSTAAMLKRKTVEREYETSCSSGFVTDETAAIAEPPQIAVPDPIRFRRSRFNPRNFPARNADENAAIKVHSITDIDEIPVEAISARLRVAPITMIDNCSTRFEVKAEALLRKDGSFNVDDIIMPERIASTGPPINGIFCPK